MKLALYMLKNDLKSIFRGVAATILYPILIFMIFIIPFFQIEYYYMAYMIFVILSLFRPRFNKIYHVVPMEIADIKRLYVYRTILFLLILVMGTGIVAGMAVLFSLPWNVRGGLTILFYAQIFAGILHEKFWGFVDKKKKNSGWIVLSVIGTVVAAFVMFGVLDLIKMPLVWQYVIQCLLVLTGLPNNIKASKDMDFHDYEISTNLYGIQYDVEG